MQVKQVVRLAFGALIASTAFLSVACDEPAKTPPVTTDVKPAPGEIPKPVPKVDEPKKEEPKKEEPKKS